MPKDFDIGVNMERVVLIVIVLLHGLLHLLGFYRSYSRSGVVNLKKHISKPLGWLWLICSLLFLINGFLILFNVNGWIYFILASLLISQVLILLSWREARYGTLVNMIILGLSIFYVMK